jgi:hypothetical protein
MLHTIRKKENGFVKLTLTITEFQKNIINPHELSYKGKMYDFKYAVISGNIVELLVINDTKEENILGKIKELTDNTDKQNSDLPNQLVKLLTLTYICPSIENKFIFQELRENNFLLLCENMVSNTNEIPFPPPRLV